MHNEALKVFIQEVCPYHDSEVYANRSYILQRKGKQYLCLEHGELHIYHGVLLEDELNLPLS